MDELASQRNEELTSVFLAMLGDGRLAKDVMFSAASAPSSRFWIQPENALRYVRMRLRGTWGNKGNEHPMMVARIDAIIKLCDGDYSIDRITQVVDSPAPSFFLEPQSAKNIIFNTLRKRRKKWK